MASPSPRARWRKAHRTRDPVRQDDVPLKPWCWQECPTPGMAGQGIFGIVKHLSPAENQRQASRIPRVKGGGSGQQLLDEGRQRRRRRRRLSAGLTEAQGGHAAQECPLLSSRSAPHASADGSLAAISFAIMHHQACTHIHAASWISILSLPGLSSPHHGHSNGDARHKSSAERAQQNRRNLRHPRQQKNRL